MAKAVRPAVVNITPAKTLVREQKGRQGRGPMDQMEEFFGFDFPRQFGPRRHGVKIVSRRSVVHTGEAWDRE